MIQTARCAQCLLFPGNEVFAVGRTIATKQCQCRGDLTNDLNHIRFPKAISQRNLLERACILTSGPEILSIDLPLQPKTSRSPVFADEFNLRDALAEWERDAIVQTLAKTQGGKAEAARRLGLSKSDITYKLAKYGISNAGGEVQS